MTHITCLTLHNPHYVTQFGGNPVSCAIALSVLRTIKKEKLMENAVKVGDFLLQEFGKLKDTYDIVGDVRFVFWSILGVFLGCLRDVFGVYLRCLRGFYFEMYL